MTNPQIRDSLASIYDNGYRAISLDNSGKNKNDSLVKVDFDAILEMKNPKKAVQAIEPISIYHALIERGAADSLAILPLLSEDQVTRIFDYDVWHDDRLIAKQAFGWLKLFGEISKKELFKRFQYLEEEYQLAILGPFIRVYDPEEYEKLSDADQDILIPLPSEESYFYEIISHDKDIRSGVEELIEATMSENMSYAMSLLIHASHMPPAEQEFEAARFRKARLEEDGFVSSEESRMSFIYVDIKLTKKKYESFVNPQSKALVETVKSRKTFIDQVIIKGSRNGWDEKQEMLIQQSFMFLANNLCSASNIETDDVHGLKIILKHAKALSSLGLEYLSSGDLDLANIILLKEYPKNLFKIGFNLVAEIRNSLINKLEVEGKKEVLDFLAQGRFGSAQEYIDQNWLEVLGFEFTETIKGFCNRYPVVPKLVDEARGKVVFNPISSLSDLSDFMPTLNETTRKN